MRRRSLLLAAAVAPIARVSQASTPAVLLELFTSQGCSSCPPADALLGTLAERPATIALAWHVDYWDGLGWHDPFASRLATDRQRAYAQRLGEEVYTPALVVNGATMVVGSDRDAIARAIVTTQRPMRPIALQRDGDTLLAEAAPDPSLTLLCAIYDPMHITRVGAGENGGRTLREYRLVRSVQSGGSGSSQRFRAPGAGQGAVVLAQTADLRVAGAAELAPAKDAAR